MTDYIRTQIFLEKEQLGELRAIATSLGISLSELVRNLLDAQLHQHTDAQMQQAAGQLYADYANGEALTTMTSLDGEDFLNASG